jgi:hypothetical protein
MDPVPSNVSTQADCRDFHLTLPVFSVSSRVHEPDESSCPRVKRFFIEVNFRGSISLIVTARACTGLTDSIVKHNLLYADKGEARNSKYACKKMQKILGWCFAKKNCDPQTSNSHRRGCSVSRLCAYMPSKAQKALAGPGTRL